MTFSIRRVNAIGNVFWLGLRGNWYIEWQSGIGGYKLQTYKTRKGAVRAAEAAAKAWPSQTVSVLDSDKRVVETFSYNG